MEHEPGFGPGEKSQAGSRVLGSLLPHGHPLWTSACFGVQGGSAQAPTTHSLVLGEAGKGGWLEASFLSVLPALWKDTPPTTLLVAALQLELLGSVPHSASRPRAQ